MSTVEQLEKEFDLAWYGLAKIVHEMAVEKGWWPEDKNARNDGELIALMHSELSEALEALRHGNPISDKTPEFTAVEEEFADVIIRMMDMCKARNWKVGAAVGAKIRMNATRTHRHGGKAF